MTRSITFSDYLSQQYKPDAITMEFDRQIIEELAKSYWFNKGVYISDVLQGVLVIRCQQEHEDELNNLFERIRFSLTI